MTHLPNRDQKKGFVEASFGAVAQVFACEVFFFFFKPVSEPPPFEIPYLGPHRKP